MSAAKATVHEAEPAAAEASPGGQVVAGLSREELAAVVASLSMVRHRLAAIQQRLDALDTAVQIRAATLAPQGIAADTAAAADLVAMWTGWHANALRQALRMTNEEFAEHLAVAVRTVVNWRTRPCMVPRQGMQQILDVALQRAPGLARAQFRRLLAEDDREGSGLAAGLAGARDGIGDLLESVSGMRAIRLRQLAAARSDPRAGAVGPVPARSS